MKQLAVIRKTIAIICIALTAHTTWAAGLFDIYELALKADPDYAAARAQYASEVRGRDLAAAAFMPSLSLSANADITQYQRQDLAGNPGQDVGYNPTGYALRLTQPLFSKERQAYQQENLLRAERAEWALLQARQELSTRLAQVIFNYLLGLDQLALAQAQAQAVRAQLTQVEALLPSRTSTRTDVADARARFEMAQVQVSLAQSQLEVRRLEFVRLTGQAPPEQLRPLAKSPALERLAPPEPVEWVAAAREQSPKVMAMRLAVRLAEAGIDRAKAGNYPTVSLNAARQQASHGNYFTSAERTDTLGVQLNMTLFDGGTIRAQTEQALAQSQRARADLQAAEHEAAVSTTQAYWGVVNGAAQVLAMEQAEAAAALALKGTQLGIQANIKTYADELNAVQLLYTTRRDLQKERYSYLLSRLQLLQTKGNPEDALRSCLTALAN
jgi:TolC family type I secretion outer membrane protein